MERSVLYHTVLAVLAAVRPNQHTEGESTLIRNMCCRNPHDGLIVFQIILRRWGYARSVSGQCKLLLCIYGKAIRLSNPKHIPKPYKKGSI